ncbi:rRNA maturation RNase YbeY [Borreliella carolinensis]|uniref:Endoribonuclease YbeY n=1 Tax=Borreliella carolinensis TaxID=478174 RepID=A0ABY9E5H0_9SPIR|nr:rRNA maturation RNase YbeY [Borreliella carolinensis]WKC90472.1 rRNA maturation RNase YbeY [Borreliella carolinensis]WNY67404.1 rRNA maturation RNase YbeY [Borreliella carolinensis]
MSKSDLNLLVKNIKFEHISVFYDFIVSVLNALSIVDFELSVILCDNVYIQELNKKFRNKNEPTDVLSFNYNELNEDLVDGINYKIQGDLVISFEYLKFSAQEFNVEIYEELQRVTIHGILHLMGYKHETNDFQKEGMLILQENILRENKRVF